MATFFLFPGQPNRATDSDGNPVSGAKMYFFEAGTSTPLTVYSDTALSSAHASPLVANSDGYFASAYISGPDEVKIRVDDASDNELYTVDYVTGVPVGGLGAASIPFTATSRIAADDVQEAIEDVDFLVEKNEAGFDLIQAAGSSNAYTMTTGLSAYTAYTADDVFLFEANHANTGAATINVNSLGAKSLKFFTAGSKTDPASGEIQTGNILRIAYDGTDFVVTDHTRSLASTAQAQAGTAQGVVMDPALTSAAITALAPDATVKVGTDSSVGTGTEKVLDLSSFSGIKLAYVMFRDVSLDGTGDVRIQLGVAGVEKTTGYVGQTATIDGGSTGSSAVTNGVAIALGNSSYTSAGICTFAHMGGNIWSYTLNATIETADGICLASGYVALSGEMDTITLAATSGNFNDGDVNYIAVV